MRALLYDAGYGLLFNVVVDDGRRFEWVPLADLGELSRCERLALELAPVDGPTIGAQATSPGHESGLSWLALGG